MVNAVLFILILVLSLSIVNAQNIQGVSPEDLERAKKQIEQIQQFEQQKKEWEERQLENQMLERIKPPLEIQAEPSTPPKGDTARCYKFSSFEVEGLTVSFQQKINDLIRQYVKSNGENVNKPDMLATPSNDINVTTPSVVESNNINLDCVTEKNVEDLLLSITKVYIDEGYVAVRAYWNDRNVNNTVLKLLIIEGKVENIVIRDNNKESVYIPNAFPFVKDNLLNLRDIEQGLDQINRLRSNSATMQILPGSVVGGSIIAIDNVSAPPYHLTLFVDNQGSESTGKYTRGITFAVDRLTGLNDYLSVAFNQSFPYTSKEKFTRSANLNYTIPLGYTLFSFGLSKSENASTINSASNNKLITSGDTNSWFFKTDYVAYRSQKTRWSFSGNLSVKNSKSYLNGTLLEVSSKKTAILDIDSNINTNIPFLGASLSVNIGISKGLDNFGSIKDPENISKDSPKAQFTKYRYGITISKILPITDTGVSLSFSSQLTGQKAKSVLYGSDQQSIGGSYSVRGFSKNSLSGDNGWVWRNDISLNLPPVKTDWGNLNFRPYIAYDRGSVKPFTNNGSDGGRLSGGAVGINISTSKLNIFNKMVSDETFGRDIGGNFTIDLYTMYPHKRPENFKNEKKKTYFRMSYDF